MASPTTLPATFTAGQVLTAAQQNALRGAFRVLQVVSATKTDTFTSTSVSFTDITGLSVSITPQSATSQIMVFAQVSGSDDVAIGPTIFRLMRDATAIDVATATSNRIPASAQFAPMNTNSVDTKHISFLDSPATTAATTYKIQARNLVAGTFYVNRSKTDTDSATFFRMASTITVMEISA